MSYNQGGYGDKRSNLRRFGYGIGVILVPVLTALLTPFTLFILPIGWLVRGIRSGYDSLRFRFSKERKSQSYYRL